MTLSRAQVNAKLDTRTEKQVWREVETELMLLGFNAPKVYLLTKNQPRAGYHGVYVHSQQARATMITVGHPDLFLSLVGSNVWVAVELKSRTYTKTGKLKAPVLTKEQRWLHDHGMLEIVRSAEDVRALVERMRDDHSSGS